MIRALAVIVFALGACGKVEKQAADAAVDAVHNSGPDAFDCSTHGPTGAFTFAPMSPGVGQPVTFTPADTAVAYSWTFAAGNPASSTAASPVVMWSATGGHTVTLAVSDGLTHCNAGSMQTLNVCTPAAAINPPAFTQNTGGHANAGIAFVPNKDTVLTSFGVGNQSMADTINLTDASGTILQTLAIPASTPNFQASVSWPLQSGVTYHLVTQQPSNGRYAAGMTYPIAGASLTVTGGWMDGALQSAYWFSFTGLVTCP